MEKDRLMGWFWTENMIQIRQEFKLVDEARGIAIPTVGDQLSNGSLGFINQFANLLAYQFSSGTSFQAYIVSTLKMVFSSVWRKLQEAEHRLNVLAAEGYKKHGIFCQFFLAFLRKIWLIFPMF